MMYNDPAAIKHLLYREAMADLRREELSLAAAAWFENAEPDDTPESPPCWAEFLDFFVLEWIDADGYTLPEHVFPDALPPLVTRWLLEGRGGVFVVDAWDDGIARLRDAATEETLETTIADELPFRSVLVGRLLPDGEGRWQPSGAPDLYDPMGVISRLELMETWRGGARGRLVSRMRTLRRAFLLQREQQRAFVDHFGTDSQIFENNTHLTEAMDGFMQHLVYEVPLDFLGGVSLAEWRRGRDLDPYAIRIEPGLSLQEARPGVIFDASQGVHFYPRYGDFLDHLQGQGHFPEVVDTYLAEDGIGRLPFRRAECTPYLAKHLGLPDAPVEQLLESHKPIRGRTAPSLLAGFDRDALES